MLLSPAYALVWLSNEARTGWRLTWNLRAQWQAQWPLLLAVAAGGTLVLLKSRQLGLDPLLGPQVTMAQIQSDPLYGMGGRVPLWPQKSLFTMLPWTLLPWDKAVLEPALRHVMAISSGLTKLVQVVLQFASLLVCVLALRIVWRHNREKAVVLLALGASGIITFWLSELLLPRLFESSRYLVWSMPILSVLSWAVVLNSMAAMIPPGRTRQAVLFFMVLALASRAPSIRGKGAEDVSEYAALFTELVRAGDAGMIACFPRTGDFIPVLCHRSVFVSNESSHAVLFSRYRDLVMQRQGAWLKAFYSAKAGEVQDFCRDNRVSWLVVEERYYRLDMEASVHFAPFERLNLGC